ncbi:uncharacterized protein LOC135346009 isoform X2 [Halichondria panicea]|uniref:uncharacterized protein LOC135346009 isoform X2 n=1 Tax=Halichondria panicea TaxID=6063 RepID=UPI00312B699D
MNYRLIAILTLTILMLIMFAHKEVSCDAGVTSTSAGNKFVVGFLRNSINEAPAVTPIDFNRTISTSSIVATIPLSFEVRSLNETNKGILVEADGNINVYGLSNNLYSQDAFLALPCTVMPVDEYEYYVISYDPFVDIMNSVPYPSVVLLVACEDGTVVTFRNSSTIILLNSTQTYQIHSDQNDLTGTRITSSKPLSVFSGSDCALVPSSSSGCDALIEQVPPTVTWGLKFLLGALGPQYISASGDIIRVLSSRAANVSVSGCTTSLSEFQLQSGGSFREFQIEQNSFCSIESTSPVLVAQYAGTVASGQTVSGGPFMMIIPPIEQFRNNYLVETFRRSGSNFVTIYVAPEFFQTADILLNENVVTGWTDVTCSSGEVCGHISRTSVSFGPHSIRHQNRSAVIGVSVFGFTGSTYGYPGGMRLSPIQCNCGQNSICLNNIGQFNCRCLNGFALMSGTDEFVCNAITCPPLTAPTNGFVTYNTTINGDGTYALDVVATYSCDTGFYLVSNTSLTKTCTGNGSSTTGAFDGQAPICEAITCPPLYNLTDGSVSYSNVPGLMATYSCDTGFALVGNKTRTCTGDGSNSTGAFNGAAPTCEPITCPAVPSPSNGSTNFSGSSANQIGNYIFNVVATYICDTGFSLVGNSSRTCTGSDNSITGSFDGQTPICEAITCPPLYNLTDGSVSYSNVPGVIATYSCDTGFALVGNKTRTCTGDGSNSTGAFNGAASTCEPITCPAVPSPSNGSTNFSGSSANQIGNYIFNVVATYNCDTGFSLVGNSSRTCTGNDSSIMGFFDWSAPTCEAITCPPLTAPTNGFVTYNTTIDGNSTYAFDVVAIDENSTYAFDVVAIYSCGTGFSLVGSNTRTCTGNGSSTIGAYDGEPPTCVAVSISLLLLFILIPVVIVALLALGGGYIAVARLRKRKNCCVSR